MADQQRLEKKYLRVVARGRALEAEIAALRDGGVKVPERLVRELARRSGQKVALETQITNRGV